MGKSYRNKNVCVSERHTYSLGDTLLTRPKEKRQGRDTDEEDRSRLGRVHVSLSFPSGRIITITNGRSGTGRGDFEYKVTRRS